MYRNYKTVDGIMFAHSCEIKAGGANSGELGAEISFYNIRLNPVIGAEKFLPDNQS